MRPIFWLGPVFPVELLTVVVFQALVPRMGDREAQRNELEILESIYGDLIWFEAEDKIRVAFDNDNVRLSVKLPENYPTL